MKLTFVITTLFLTCGIASAAWADAASLETQEVGVTTPSENRSDRLEVLAGEINQDASQEQNQSDRQIPSLDELDEVLNLPEGMIIRGTRSSGLGIGTEF